MAADFMDDDGLVKSRMVLTGSKVTEGIADLRLNTQGTILASSARTVTATSPVQTNYNARGVVVFLKITVASGTGGLKVYVRGIDNSGISCVMNSDHTPTTTTGSFAYVLYPGANGTGLDIKQATSLALPRTFDVIINHGDATSYTYSVGYALIL